MAPAWRASPAAIAPPSSRVRDVSKSVRITSVNFSRFKALRRHKLRLDHLNILVGPNNSGKSTIIGSVRALQAGLRHAKSRTPVRIGGSVGQGIGYRISESSLPMSLENVHTDYASEDSSVTFQLSNQNKLHLVFPADGGCVLVPEVPGSLVGSVSQFKRHFPIELTVVPVLGPVEHREVRRERDTVVSGLWTHRASRHFRSYWYHFQDGFADFAELEPISKSFKQYQQGCELHKAQEVIRIVLPARHNTALPLEPGKKTLDLPPPRIAT